MTTDLGFSGQESDVNHACSAFGLGTVNYRAFPNNGPVLTPASEPATSPRVTEPMPASPAVSAASSQTPAGIAVPQQTQDPAQPPGNPMPQLPPVAMPAAAPRPVPAWPAAPMPAALPPSGPQQWTQAAAPSAYPAGAASNLDNLPPSNVPPRAFYPSGQHQAPGMPGADFSLLRQAMPSAFTSAPAPMPAFAMARAVLQPLPSGFGVRPAEARPAASSQTSPGANPESFGVAFGAAFNTAFGNASTGLQRPQS
jgi:hypothetical protein